METTTVNGQGPSSSTSSSSSTSTRSHRGVKIALVSGVLMGAAAAILFAPKRGKDLRRQIADSARRASRRASKTLADTSVTVNDVVARSRRAVDAARQAYGETGAAGPKPIDARPTDVGQPGATR